MKICDKGYESSPFVVALYYGNAKPKNVNYYVGDFVEETTNLTNHGISVGEREHGFKIMAIVADSPARAFLKCVKGATAYYGCERCTVEVKTCNKRRVSSQLDCELRTKESFRDQTHQGHHLKDAKTGEFLVSPLLTIPHFDPIKDFPLETMHLLNLNVMKNLAEKWMKLEKNSHKPPVDKRQAFKELMSSISTGVTIEFQRNEFDVDDICHWRATQYSFLLLYAGKHCPPVRIG
uniref:PiggyBac transposable element-derived protein domain-containing protein n=1 Tax=Bracon brevicornis TaxID=1563983 RepID=A0A6V7KNG8_9HYME